MSPVSIVPGTIDTSSSTQNITLSVTVAITGNSGGCSLSQGGVSVGEVSFSSTAFTQTAVDTNVGAGGTFTATAQVRAGLTPTLYAVNAAYTGATVPCFGPGCSSATRRTTGNSGRPVTLTVRGPQAITFGTLSNKTYGNAPFALSATSTSGLTVSFASSTPSVCTVSGTTATIGGAGSCTIVASQNGSGSSYYPAPNVSRTFTVNKATQAITLVNPGPQIITNGSVNLTVSGGASGNPVTMFSAGTCSLSGTTVTFANVGGCTITANQAGNANYAAAPQTSITFAINRATQTVAFATLPARTIGDPIFGVTATASSGLIVDFSAGPAGVCSMRSARFVSIDGVGQCTVTARQAGSTTYEPAETSRSFAIQRANQTIFFPNPSLHTFGSGPFALEATTTSGLPVTYASNSTGVCTVSGSTVSIVSVGDCSITANQAGNTNYNAATPVTVAFVIGKANQTIAFGALANQTYGVGSITLGATASSGLPVSFGSSTLSTCTITGANTLNVIGAGTCSVTAFNLGDANYFAGSAMQSFNIAKAPQAINLSNPSTTPYGPGKTIALNVSGGASGNPVVITSYSTNVCTVSGTTLTVVSIGLCLLGAEQAGNANYTAAPPVSTSFTITQTSQAIAFLTSFPDQVYGVAPIALRATASSGLPVTFASNTTAVCTVSGDTLSVVGTGTCSVTASQAGDANYAAAPSLTRTFTVNPAGQTIAFTNPGAQTFAPGGTIPLTATGGASGNPIVITSNSSGVCTVAGTTATMVSAGTCSLTANQAGNANYAAATAVTVGFAMDKTDQSITFAALPNENYGREPLTLSATASSGLPVTFASSTTSVCTVSGNIMSIIGTGTCSITASQTGDATYTSAPSVMRTFTVNPGVQSIIFSHPGSVVYSPGGTIALTVSGGASGNPVVITSSTPETCTVSGTTAAIVAAGLCSLTANQAGNANYAAAQPNTVSFPIGKAAQTITFDTLADQPYGAGPLTLNATASSGLPVTLISGTNSVCTLSGNTLSIVGTGTCLIEASQPGNVSYGAASSVRRTFTVLPAAQAITFANPGAQTFAPSGTVALTATGGASGNPVVITSNSSGVCTLSGTTATMVAAGTCSLTANQAGNANYAAAAPVTMDFAIGKANQTISFANPGTRTYGDGALSLSAIATSGLAVSFASTSGAVCSVSGTTLTILAAGTCKVTASQVGDANYNPAPGVSVSFTIDAAATTTSVASSLNPALIGQNVTFTASVSPAVATGVVTFMDGATVLGTGTIAAGTATFSTASLVAGAHSIRAEYAGGGNYGSSTSAAFSQTITANGTVTLAVRASEGDGTFSFSSSTPGLSLAVATSGGLGTSGGISLNPGTYTVTAILPDGFGLTGVSCSDANSSGSVAGKSATIALSPNESVTCTFVSANSRAKTVEVISKFMSRRADLMLSTGPDTNRQVDRLLEAEQQGSGGGPQSSFAGSRLGDASPTDGIAPSRLGGSAFVPNVPGSPTNLARQFGQGVQGSQASAYDPRPGAFDGRQFGPAGEDGIASEGPSSRAMPLTMRGSDEGPTRFSFATSLSQMVRSATEVDQMREQNMAEAAGLAMTPWSGNRVPFSPFDMWVEGHYSDFTDDRRNRDAGGHFGIFYAGADYVISPQLLVGVLVQYDSMSMSSRSQSYEVSGNGWMAGPYATVRLSENVFLQGRAAWGMSDNSVRPFNTYSDDFETKRWLVSSTLVGRWQQGPWEFRPTASLAYIEDSADAYTDSLGVRIPGVKVSIGQFKAGPEISYRLELSDGTVLQPSLGIEAIWNFESTEQAANFGGTLAGPEEIRGRVEIGLKGQLPNGLGFDLSASYDGIGSNSYEAISGRATLRVPLN